MIVATARYWDRSGLMGAANLAPVGTSVGMPKFLGYELAGTVGPLAPYGLLKIEDEAEFTARYRERLDAFGVARIQEILDAIATAGRVVDGRVAPYAGVALLCFERPGEFCHRRVFADWWEEQTGVEVPELGQGELVIPAHS